MVRTESTTAAISGGGPAGVMLGLLLARAGVQVTVLEKHADFLRDFRGDTVHPSTLEILDELGLDQEFRRLPQRAITTLRIGSAEQSFVQVDLRDLPSEYHHVAMVPQWDFLELLTARAKHYPHFRLLMDAEATGLIEENGAVHGLRYTDTEGEHELRSVLTVSAEGRDSGLRAAAGMAPTNLGAPMDVLWLRLSRHPDDPSGMTGSLGKGAMAVAIDRDDYWQIAYLIRKGGYARIRSQPVEVVQDRLRGILPFLGGRVRELQWDGIAFLEVGLDRLARWYRPGFLCIGDAAHAMTPVGGVGINLAIQDAVATANLLADPLRRAEGDPGRFSRSLNPEFLARVQRRRWMATVGTQTVQRLAQRQVISRALAANPTLPPPLRLVAGTRAWSRLVARVMMYGLLPEHVRTPERVDG